MPKIPRVADYCRVSTLDKHADIQVEAIRRAARERGGKLVAEDVDTGVSSGRDRRPALRLGRSLAQVLKLLDL